LNPFGLFGALASSEHAKLMVERYGMIPAESETTNIRGLSTFLSDFVLDVGPLAKKADRYYDALERAEVPEQYPLVPERISQSVVPPSERYGDSDTPPVMLAEAH
jgi:hypothetical protein